MTVQDSKSPIFERFNSYQPSKTILVWACAATAIATIVVGFNWGGWVTGGSSLQAATAAGKTARGELASAICVERFKAAPDATEKMIEFKALSDSFAKRQFIEAGGWASMPGQTPVDSDIVESCSTARSSSVALDAYSSLGAPAGAPRLAHPSLCHARLMKTHHCERVRHAWQRQNIS